MGDSPSVGYLLHGTRDDPSQPGLGRPVRARLGWPEDDLRSADDGADRVEAFGVVEFALPVPAGMTPAQSARMIFDGRIPAVGTPATAACCGSDSRRATRRCGRYVIRSDFPGLDGESGRFTASRATDLTNASSFGTPSELVDRRS